MLELDKGCNWRRVGGIQMDDMSLKSTFDFRILCLLFRGPSFLLILNTSGCATIMFVTGLGQL